jgi:DNA polymerase-3 subunit epsilon
MPRRDDKDFNRTSKADEGRKRNPVLYFNSKKAKCIVQVLPHYNLCQKLTGLYHTKTNCFQYSIKECDGACISSPEEYNARVQNFIEKHR